VNRRDTENTEAKQKEEKYMEKVSRKVAATPRKKITDTVTEK